MEELLNNEPVIKSEEVDTETTATTGTVEEQIATSTEAVVETEETPVEPAEASVAETEPAVEENEPVKETQAEDAENETAEAEPEEEQEVEFDIPSTESSSRKAKLHTSSISKKVATQRPTHQPSTQQNSCSRKNLLSYERKELLNTKHWSS